jgi:hypothetical protein
MPTKHVPSFLAILTCFVSVVGGCKKTETITKTIIDTFPISVPKVYADSSRTITLPVDSVRLNGSATDPTGEIAAWLWSEVSGPNVAVIQTAGSPSTTISGLTTGVYVFQLMVVDTGGGTGVGQVTVTVHPATTITLRTLFDWGRYETYFQDYATTDITNINANELDATAWTYGGIFGLGRSAFVFNMGGLLPNTPVRSALLSLYSNHSPASGNMVDANYGSTNAFYISRIGNAWDHATTLWPNQPGLDTVGQVLIPQSNQSYLDITNVDVTTMVNNMISSGNYGFEIRLQTEQIYNSRMFYSTIESDSTRWPKLVVSY